MALRVSLEGHEDETERCNLLAEGPGTSAQHAQAPPQNPPVAHAEANARQWAAQRAQATATAAVAIVARDLRAAGFGFEGAASIQLYGERVPTLEARGAQGVLLLRAVAPAFEIYEHGAGSQYTVSGLTGLETGAVVAAVGMPERPPSAPLPAARIAGVMPVSVGAMLRVVWGSAEAQLLEAWGPPRALLVVEAREFGLRRLDDGLQLRRRDGSGSWQPAIDGLNRFAVTQASACRLVVEAGATGPDGRPLTALEWVRSPLCATTSQP